MTDLLKRMRQSPAGDWMISDVEAVCRSLGANCRPPSGGGSHYKVSHPSQTQILTIPFRKPLKPVYIRKLVRFLEAIGGQSGGA